jgi:hypothetical protein
MSLVAYTAAERPDLWERGIPSAAVWPEYNLHGDNLNQWWGHLDEELADYQFVLYDEATDEVLAEGHTGPLWWDGSDQSLLSGIDEAIGDVFARTRSGQPVNTLCALAAEIPSESRSRGLAVELLGAMRAVAQRQGLTHLVAPVRPSYKERYPLTPIERYMLWRREDGLLYDPWLRTHERLGAELLDLAPRSSTVTGSRDEWEEWTGLQFPEDGDYVVPRALVPVHFEGGHGTYVEPNVWMKHPLYAD